MNYRQLQRGAYSMLNSDLYNSSKFLNQSRKFKALQKTLSLNQSMSAGFKNGSTPPADERNIEIKAVVGSDEEFQRRLEIARKLTGSDGELIPQRDVFFKSETGRLKLRYLITQPSQLVYYDRPDVSGPKLSKFNKMEVDEPEILEKILSQSNGRLGELEKQRHLFMYKRTRIHLDKVKDLGNFMEFEVCLLPEQSVEEGQAVAEELMKTFGIKQEDLMKGAYFDEKKLNNSK